MVMALLAMSAGAARGGRAGGLLRVGPILGVVTQLDPHKLS